MGLVGDLPGESELAGPDGFPIPCRQRTESIQPASVPRELSARSPPYRRGNVI